MSKKKKKTNNNFENNNGSTTTKTKSDKNTPQYPKTAAHGNVPSGESVSKCKGNNDPSWYAQDQQLLKDVASLSFAQMAGNNLNFPPIVGWTQSTPINRIPGIMRIYLEPTLGAGATSVDAPSVAARNIYTFVRHANSGSANYESPDLYMMILAHASAQSLLEELKRVYGILRLYSTRNRYYGRVLVSSMGYNYDSLIKNMPAFRAFINITADKLDSIKIPSSMPIVERWKWVSSNIYGDSDSTKAQIYFTQFRSYLKFSGYTSDNGTELIPMPYMSLDNGPRDMLGTGKTLDEIITYVDDLIDPLFYEEDVGIMSGDIMKAFGDAVCSVSGIDENHTVLPVYNTEVLNQIHNIKFMLVDAQDEIYHTITQEDGAVIKELITAPFNNKSRLVAAPFVYDSYDESPDPASVMVGTRLIPVVEESIESEQMRVTACGSEIATCAVVYNFTDTLLNAIPIFYAMDSLTAVGTCSAFDWHPRVLVVDYDKLAINAWLGDLENYTIIENSSLTNMHKVAILSEMAYSSKTSLK